MVWASNPFCPGRFASAPAGLHQSLSPRVRVRAWTRRPFPRHPAQRNRIPCPLGNFTAQCFPRPHLFLRRSGPRSTAELPTAPVPERTSIISVLRTLLAPPIRTITPRPPAHSDALRLQLRMCLNASEPPPTATNPKPLSALNHLTLLRPFWRL